MKCVRKSIKCDGIFSLIIHDINAVLSQLSVFSGYIRWVSNDIFTYRFFRESLKCVGICSLIIHDINALLSQLCVLYITQVTGD